MSPGTIWIALFWHIWLRQTFRHSVGAAVFLYARVAGTGHHVWKRWIILRVDYRTLPDARAAGRDCGSNGYQGGGR